jgi:hypothetical protein
LAGRSNRPADPESGIDNPALRRSGSLGSQQSSIDSENQNLSGTAKLWGGVLGATSAALVVHGASVFIRDMNLPSLPSCYGGPNVESKALLASGVISGLLGVGAIITGIASQLLPYKLDCCIQKIMSNSPDADTARVTKKRLVLTTAAFALATCVEIPVLEIFEKKGLREEKSTHDAVNKSFEGYDCSVSAERYLQITPPVAQINPPSHLAHLTVPAPAAWQVIEPRQTPKASPEPASKT